MQANCLHWITSGILMWGFGFLFPWSREKKYFQVQCNSLSNAFCILTSFYSWKLYIDPIVLLISVLKVEVYVNGDWIRSKQIFNTVFYSVYINKLPKNCHVIVFHKNFSPVTKKTKKKTRPYMQVEKKMVQLVLWTFAISFISRTQAVLCRKSSRKIL